MGFVKYQKGKAAPHEHAYLPQADGQQVCACGAVKPAAAGAR